MELSESSVIWYDVYMKTVTFITGNQHKADYLGKYLGHPVAHQAVDVDEIQSLDLKEIVRSKVMQAFEHVQGPVLVDDVSLEFKALGRLPGTFIKFFIEEMTFEQICDLLQGQTREAVARCVMGYYDGKDVRLFESSLKGQIAEKPSGDKGFGWDSIFIPEGYSVTRASLDEEDDRKTYLQIKPLAELKVFLNNQVA